MVRQTLEPYLIDNAELIFRPNFSGEKQQYNAAGDRNFTLRLTPEDARALQSDGWNVKILDPREEGDEPTPILKVKVSFANRAPNVTLVGDITGRQTRLSEDLVGMVDHADIRKIDLILSPYQWEVNDNQGVTAYLKTMYVTIFEDPLDVRYGQMAREVSGGAIEAEIIDEPKAIER